MSLDQLHQQFERYCDHGGARPEDRETVEAALVARLRSADPSTMPAEWLDRQQLWAVRGVPPARSDDGVAVDVGVSSGLKRHRDGNPVSPSRVEAGRADPGHGRFTDTIGRVEVDVRPVALDALPPLHYSRARVERCVARRSRSTTTVGRPGPAGSLLLPLGLLSCTGARYGLIRHCRLRLTQSCALLQHSHSHTVH